MSDLRARLQQKLSGTYEIERELTGGGMSRVFVAEESALGRKVVVKVLPTDVTEGVNLDRFKREIQLAARLQHPHIVQMLSAGEIEGLPYYTMPFIEGESLRATLGTTGAMPITRAISILRDLARALAYAHERGIVHRDIKPDNILLSGGSATVTDFGIAKAISAARTDSNTTLTQVGSSIGTPAYMAPEQAAADPSTDHRADIYSFGCVAYELFAGRPPFIAKTPQKLLAAQMGETPQRITDLRPDTPPELADLVMKCLEKDADNRPQQAADLVSVLDTVTSGTGHNAMPAILLGQSGSLKKALLLYVAAFVIVPIVARAAIIAIGLPGWVFPGAIIIMLLGLPVILFTAYVHRVTRKAVTMTPHYTPGGTPSIAQGTMATLAIKASPHMSWRRTGIGGLYAVGAFVALIGGYMLLRALGIGPAGSLLAAGTVGKNEKILVADFTPPTSDTSLGPVITEAFRTALGQSQSVSVLQQNAMRDVLRRMERPQNTHVDFALAREIATREGVRALVDGNILALGGDYVISLRLVTANGDELDTFRETADGQKEILPAIDRLAKEMRAKIGESLKTIQRAPPLEQVTTASLDALKKYVQGAKAAGQDGDWVKGEALLKEAIMLDTGFAMAYRKLAVEYSNRGNTAATDSLLEKAFLHRDRLSDTERYLLLGTYYQNGRHQDVVKTISAYEQLLDMQPNNTAAMNNVANAYRYLQEYPKAVDMYQKAITIGPVASVHYSNLVNALVWLGKFDSARTVAESYRKAFPANADAFGALGSIFAARAEYDSAAAIYDDGLKNHSTQPIQEAGFMASQARLAFLHGRVQDGTRLETQSREKLGWLREPDAALITAIAHAGRRAGIFADTAGALRALNAGLSGTSLEVLPPSKRPYLQLAFGYAAAGRPDRAREFMAQWERTLVSVQRTGDSETRHRLQGDIALAEKRYAVAINEYTEAAKRGCDFCSMSGLSRAQEQAGQLDAATKTASWLANRKEMGMTGPGIPLAYERLGFLYEKKGDKPRAISAYQEFVELWKNADAELQPRVQKARARIAALKS